MKHISTIDFAKVKDSSEIILLDVRTLEEFNFVNLGGTHIPLDQLDKRYEELNKNKTIYCLCHHGIRSQYAAQVLEQFGFENTVNIEGGIEAYAQMVDSNLLRY